MKSLIVFLTLFLCSCSSNEQKIKNSYGSSDTSTLEIKRDTVYVDPELKNKMLAAFSLIKKYAKESISHPESSVRRRIMKYKQILFGNIDIQSGYVKEIQIESNITAWDLLVFFEEGEYSDNGEIARTVKFEGGHVIVFKKKFIRKNSIAIIASVLIHEMTHLLLIENNKLQNPDQKRENEYNAYSKQLDFLVYLYGGPDEELKSAESQSFRADPPDSAKKHFNFFFHMVDSLRFK